MLTILKTTQFLNNYRAFVGDCVLPQKNWGNQIPLLDHKLVVRGIRSQSCGRDLIKHVNDDLMIHPSITSYPLCTQTMIFHWTLVCFVNRR